MQFGHNFDDLTDISVPGCYAFGQRDPRSLYMMGCDGAAIPPGTELTLYAFPELNVMGTAITEHVKVRAQYVQPSLALQQEIAMNIICGQAACDIGARAG